MQRLFWIVGGVLLLMLLYFTALPGNLAVGQQGEGLVGTYTVNGIDPTGLEYSGTLVIADPNAAQIYPMEWIITGSIVRGEGVLAGNQLTVDWHTTAAASEGQGTARYTVRADGSLSGTRTVDGFDEPGTEDIFPDA